MKSLKMFLLVAIQMVCGSQLMYAQQWGDYILYSTQNSTTTTLLDTNRTVFKTWSHAGYKTGYSSYLAPGGYLYKTISKSGVSFTGGPICGQIIKMDWAGNIVWNYTYSTTDYCSHHDFHVMPNGNVLLIAYERHTAAEVAALGGSFNGEVWSEHVAEIKQTGETTGEVVWKWRVWDHMLQTTDASKPNYYAAALDHPELFNINYGLKKDWIHMNGIDYNPITDQIAVSSHNLNEWYIIDHSTSTEEAASHSGGFSGKGGDILFRWGNPAAYGASGTTILNVTHDAHWIPEGVPNAGRLVGFNNKGVSATKSAVDQIILPQNGYNFDRTAGQAFAPSTYTERHASTGYTSNMGNSQQLPNGNMLVCLALSGIVYEINSAGTTLWSKSMGGSVPQSFKYEKCYVENQAPTQPTITKDATTLNSSAASAYQWYKNGVLIEGANQQTYTPTEEAIYVVRIKDAAACFNVYSASYKYSNTSTGLNDDLKLNELKVFPNPSTGIFNLELDGITDFNTMVFSMNGDLVFEGENIKEIDLSSLANGVYFLHVSSENKVSVTKKLVISK
ncbi:MAG: aryl-sulfate sulfotransferase [Bacteroidia bacterium]